jgi:hypothetical protein
LKNKYKIEKKTKTKKRKPQHKKNKTLYFLGGWVLVNLFVYCSVLVYCNSYNTKHKEKITPANLSLDGGDVNLQIAGNGYKIETSRVDKDKLEKIVYFATPTGIRLFTEVLGLFEGWEDWGIWEELS